MSDDLEKRVDEHAYRIGHLEEKVKNNEGNTNKNFEAVVLRLDDVKQQLDQIRIEKLIEADRESRNKHLSAFVNLMVQIGANLFVILVALKTFNLI